MAAMSDRSSSFSGRQLPVDLTGTTGADDRAGHPGEASVQVTATAAGPTPCRSATGRSAHTLDRITTDTRLCLSPDAEKSSDVAFAAGRLVYTALGWTLTSGPARQP